MDRLPSVPFPHTVRVIFKCKCVKWKNWSRFGYGCGETHGKFHSFKGAKVHLLGRRINSKKCVFITVVFVELGTNMSIGTSSLLKAFRISSEFRFGIQQLLTDTIIILFRLWIIQLWSSSIYLLVIIKTVSRRFLPRRKSVLAYHHWILSTRSMASGSCP